MGKLGRVNPVVLHDGVDTDDDNEQIDLENAAFDEMLSEWVVDHGAVPVDQFASLGDIGG